MSDSGGLYYQQVSRTFTADRVALTQNPISSGFNCHDELDIGSEAVEVQKGDVIGACIFDPDNFFLIIHSQLDIVGEANDHSLLEMNDVSECDFGAIPSRISATDLREQTSRILHLYADIGK